jgi:micrococcal nuclease
VPGSSIAVMKVLLILVPLLLLGCSAAGPVAARWPAPPAGALRATVTRVVDGDTVIARLPGQSPVRVRIIGVDTPETVKPHAAVGCFGIVASSYAKRLLTGSQVRAAYEPGGRTDRYGRQLWDLWLPDGRLVAGLLVANGLGRAYPFPPQIRYAVLLHSLQSAAQTARRGLWGPPCRGRSFTTPDRAPPGQRPPATRSTVPVT